MQTRNVYSSSTQEILMIAVTSTGIIYILSSHFGIFIGLKLLPDLHWSPDIFLEGLYATTQMSKSVSLEIF